MEDFFGNVPDIVIDKILEKLPIDMAARSSVLSKQWRRAWLSLRILVFDDVCFRHIADSQKRSEIISNILFYHRGPVHEFYFYLWAGASDVRMNHNSWISFLSENGVRKIVISNLYTKMDITSNIFCCSEIVHLHLKGFNLNHPPMNFSGFPNLKHLELEYIVFRKQNIFCSLIESCRKLETVKLKNWSGLDHVVIDAPSLQTLVLQGNFESLSFRNVRNLKSISMCLYKMRHKIATAVTVDAVNLLASSCQLQSIQFHGQMCKFLAAGRIIGSSPGTFNHLDKLCLSDLNLSDFGVFRYLLHTIECCPYIKKLDISVMSVLRVGRQDILDCNCNYKLGKLLEIKIAGITGLSAELKLIEYLLAISDVLEKLFFKLHIGIGIGIGIESELRLAKVLMRFPRASPKASLVWLEK